MNNPRQANSISYTIFPLACVHMLIYVIIVVICAVFHGVWRRLEKSCCNFHVSCRSSKRLISNDGGRLVSVCLVECRHAHRTSKTKLPFRVLSIGYCDTMLVVEPSNVIDVVSSQSKNKRLESKLWQLKPGVAFNKKKLTALLYMRFDN